MKEVIGVAIITILSLWAVVSIIMLLIQQHQMYLLKNEFDKYKKESVIWSLGDIYVEAERLKITIEEPVAQEILEKMIAEHNAWQGITWETIDRYIMDACTTGKIVQYRYRNDGQLYRNTGNEVRKKATVDNSETYKRYR